jgi:hypothetical protein
LAITIGNSVQCLPNSGTGNAQASAAIDTTGATLLVALCGRGQSVPTTTASDSKSNTWSSLTPGTGSNPESIIFYVVNPTVGTGHTFTIGSAGGYAAAIVSAFTGVDTSSPFDQQNATGAAGWVDGTAFPGSITPGVNNELVVSCAASQLTTTSWLASGMTIIDQIPFNSGISVFHGVATAYVVQTSAAAINPNWTQGASWAGAMSIASFKAAAAGPGPTAVVTFRKRIVPLSP